MKELIVKHLRKRATVVVIRDSRVLLVRDKGKHHFSLPGGGVHHNEPSLSAAARELYEETGLKATAIIRMFNYRGKVNEHRVFVVKADGHIHLGKELSTFIWWDRKTAIPIYSHVTDILNLYDINKEGKKLARPSIQMVRLEVSRDKLPHNVSRRVSTGVFSDKRGERMSRRYHRGWKKVKFT